MLSGHLVKYVLKAVLRDRLVLSLLLFTGVLTGLSLFMGGASVSEAGQFSLVFTGSSVRLAGTMGIALFVVFYVRRSFESKDIEFLLSRPLSRSSFIFSHAAAFSFLALFLAVFMFLTVVAAAPQRVGEGHFLWFVSVAVEFIVVANAALFFSMVLTSAVSSMLAVSGLYVMARMMGLFLGIVDHGIERESLEALVPFFQGISMIIPRFDLMAQSSWLIYGTAESSIGFGFILAQGFVYTLLLLLAALIDLKKRQF